MLETPFLSLLRARRSIRRFKPDPVEREKILACLEAARLAPSAQNLQPWRFLVVEDPEEKAKISAAAFGGIYRTSRFAAGAPVLIVLIARLDVVANRIGRAVQGTAYYLIDMGIAGQHLSLQAEALGLGTCWMGWFNARRLRKALKLPRGRRVVALMPLGYPEKIPSRAQVRKPMEEIAWFDRVGE
jgi:nitroreductase